MEDKTEGVLGETLLRSLLRKTVDHFHGYDGVRLPSCGQMWRLAAETAAVLPQVLPDG